VKVLRVTYTSGRVEDIEGADQYSIGDRNSATLLVEGYQHLGGYRRDLIKTLVLANVESYVWVEAP
jgi:hypothetical protein